MIVLFQRSDMWLSWRVKSLPCATCNLRYHFLSRPYMADFFHITTLVVTFNSPGCEGLYLKDWHFVHTYQSKGQEALDGGSQCLLQIYPKRKLKMLASKRNILFQGAIFRFYVGFRGCIPGIYRQVALKNSLFEWSFVAAYFLSQNPAWQAPYSPPSFLSSRMHDWLNHYKGITAPGKARPMFVW